MNFTTKFNFKQSVLIKDLGLKGRISSIFIDDEKGIQYNVRYFVGSDAKSCYFYEEELEEFKEPIKLGF